MMHPINLCFTYLFTALFKCLIPQLLEVWPGLSKQNITGLLEHVYRPNAPSVA